MTFRKAPTPTCGQMTVGGVDPAVPRRIRRRPSFRISMGGDGSQLVLFLIVVFVDSASASGLDDERPVVRVAAGTLLPLKALRAVSHCSSSGFPVHSFSLLALGRREHTQRLGRTRKAPVCMAC
ncbi:hypothetical protein ACGFOU_04230 [Streptomyces sp. NPDC048595]|uniref:hypothetical protein n=1 Tax=Streptomyces sp. NPDC048595 TaxID=3365576 RepID=UPI003722814C